MLAQNHSILYIKTTLNVAWPNVISKTALWCFNLTSIYMEGRRCPLASRDHSHDGKRGKEQIEFDLLCNQVGCPVAVEVFYGNTADPMTVGRQIGKLR